jgi:hypothetical protein
MHSDSYFDKMRRWAWPFQAAQHLLPVILVLLLSQLSSAEELPPGTGTTKPFYSCRSTADCVAGSACVDNGGDGHYFCKPYCATDDDCKKWPYPTVKCLAVVDTAGRNYTTKICNDRQSTLATTVANHTPTLEEIPPGAGDLPPGTGSTNPFYSCFSTVDCAARNACVDNGGDGHYYCKPYCVTDDDCKKWPYSTVNCLPVTDAAGRNYATKICNDNQSTLATILTNRTPVPTGPVSWYEVSMRAPEAQYLRIKVALRSDAVKNEIRARVTEPVQAAVASRMGTLHWVNFRFSNFRASVDSISIGPSRNSTAANIVVSGTVYAAREQYVWHWEGIHSGMRWEGRGDKDVATFRATFAITGSATDANELSTQNIVFDPVPASNSYTMNLAPVRGMTINNELSIPKPPAQTYSLAQVATQVPAPLRKAKVRYVHFTAISDSELVLQADVN